MCLIFIHCFVKLYIHDIIILHIDNSKQEAHTRYHLSLNSRWYYHEMSFMSYKLFRTLIGITCDITKAS